MLPVAPVSSPLAHYGTEGNWQRVPNLPRAALSTGRDSGQIPVRFSAYSPFRHAADSPRQSLTEFASCGTRVSARQRNCMDRDSHEQRLERFSRSERIFPGGSMKRVTARAVPGSWPTGLAARCVATTTPTTRPRGVGETEGSHDFCDHVEPISC